MRWPTVILGCCCTIKTWMRRGGTTRRGAWEGVIETEGERGGGDGGGHIDSYDAMAHFNLGLLQHGVDIDTAVEHYQVRRPVGSCRGREGRGRGGIETNIDAYMVPLFSGVVVCRCSVRFKCCTSRNKKSLLLGRRPVSEPWPLAWVAMHVCAGVSPRQVLLFAGPNICGRLSVSSEGLRPILLILLRVYSFRDY